MKILVIDGMGGGIGKAIVERIRRENQVYTILAVGTNAIAASAMHKAGADQAAAGENAAVYNCGRADVIIGSIGITLANSMLGEISPRIAEAVSSSSAVKILIPTSKCNAIITGLRDLPTAQYIEEIPDLLRNITSHLTS